MVNVQRFLGMTRTLQQHGTIDGQMSLKLLTEGGISLVIYLFLKKLEFVFASLQPFCKFVILARFPVEFRHGRGKDNDIKIATTRPPSLYRLLEASDERTLSILYLIHSPLVLCYL